LNKIALKASVNGKLNISELEHPNKMPFKGVLTYLNRMSKEPPHGANGLRVFIPADVGKPAIASLKGMAVNYIENNPVGHDPKNKVGVITDAYVGETQDDGGIPIIVEGYVYALDFEEAAVSIKASQSVLGFSYETAQTQLVKGEVDGVPCAIVTSLGYFTGASILYRDSASYGDTSLAASIDNKEDNNVDLEKLLAELKVAFKEEVDSLRQEFGHKEEPVVEEPKVEEPVVEEPKIEEPVVEEPKVEEPVVEEPVVEEPKVEEPKAEPVVEEAQLNASSLVAELTALKAELESLKNETSLQASARKSVMYPTSALAKYDLNEEDDKTKLMASIDSKTDLSIEERLAMKFEALDKLKN
jgi:hypothetical protein